jgi:CRP-like cAMP-binding protein
VAQELVSLLGRVPIFQGLEDRELERIAASMKERTFRSGDNVTTEGSGGVGFFIISDGEAKVSVGGEERRRLGPGDYFGEVALLTDSPRTATIVAESDLHCYGMTSWDFKPLVESHNTIAWKLLQAMAKNYQSPSQ